MDTDSWSGRPGARRRRAWPLLGVALLALLTSACNAIAMGRNVDGRLGDGTTIDRSTPVGIAPDIAFDAVDAGDNHSCGISDGALYCWGSNLNRQLGATIEGHFTSTPVRVGSADDWTAVSAGGSHTCGLREPGRLFCWGGNSLGQVDPARTVTVINPTELDADETWVDVSAGQAHTCALASTGTGRALSCWGFNGEGRLGDGSDSGQGAIDRPITTVHDWEDVEAGVHTCGIRTGRRLYCWGGNSNGQLGLNTLTPRFAPTRVGTGTDWIEIGVGERHTCGLLDEGSELQCWGRNFNGQVGDGTTIDRFVPTPVEGALGWEQLSVGGFHTCGVQGGQAKCWGANGFGALGDGTTIDRHFPVPVDTEATGVLVAAGRNHTLVIDVEPAT